MREIRCLASTGRLSALRPPLTGGDLPAEALAKAGGLQTPGANAPRERDVLRVGLFEIVKEEDGHAHETTCVRGHDLARFDA